MQWKWAQGQCMQFCYLSAFCLSGHLYVSMGREDLGHLWHVHKCFFSVHFSNCFKILFRTSLWILLSLAELQIVLVCLLLERFRATSVYGYGPFHTIQSKKPGFAMKWPLSRKPQPILALWWLYLSLTLVFSKPLYHIMIRKENARCESVVSCFPPP